MADDKEKPEEEEAPKAPDPVASLKEFLQELGKSNLDLPEDRIVAAPLAFEALVAAAEALGARHGARIAGDGASRRILVTAEADLAASSAAFLEVQSAIEGLLAAVDALVPPAVLKLPTGDEVPGGFDQRTLVPAAAGAVAAVAGLVPSLLALLTPRHTIRMSAIPGNDLAAAAAVIAELNDRVPAVTFVHDDLRPLPMTGAVREALARLAAGRVELIKARSKLSGSKQDKPRVDAIDAVVRAIDEFGAAIRVVSPGARRSILATALLAQSLYGGPDQFSHVLLVKSEGGFGTQTIEERPLLANDRVFILTESAITFLFVDLATSAVVASGTMSGKALGSGTIGPDFAITWPGSGRD